MPPVPCWSSAGTKAERFPPEKPTPKPTMKAKPTAELAQSVLPPESLAWARPAINFLLPQGPAVLKLKSILVPVDFSGRSLQGLIYAFALAKQFKAVVTLVHVIRSAEAGPRLGSLRLHGARWQTAEYRLAQWAGRAAPSGVAARYFVREGVPHRAITALAREENLDLIVLTTHGHTGLKQVWLGSDAERVVRHAPCPVLVVRKRQHEFVHT